MRRENDWKKQQPQKQNTENCLNYIKVELSPSKKIVFIYFNDSPLKIIRKAFYFILKALFVLKIFKFLSWLFGHVDKTAWLEK